METPPTDGAAAYNDLMVTIGGVMLLTLALVAVAVAVFIGRNIAPRLKESRRKELFRITYLKDQQDTRIAREVIEEEWAREIDEQFRNITDPMKRDFKRKED